MRLPTFALGLAIFTTFLTIPSRADEPKQEAKQVEPKAADGDAPLPEGFPDATKPGTVEVKTYPAYRSAVATVEKATTRSGNMMFFPLFNHIQKNDIAMTAPVINTFKTPKMVETPGAKGEVTMEFLYRSPKQGKTGRDSAMIEVLDHPEQKFVCLGYQGDMSDEGMRAGVARLNEWIEEHKAEWQADGPPRSLGYHGPMTPSAQRLWEVQVPVKAVK